VKNDPWHVQALLWHAVLGWLVCAPVVFAVVFGAAKRYLASAARFRSSHALDTMLHAPPGSPHGGAPHGGSPPAHAGAAAPDAPSSRKACSKATPASAQPKETV
jgi:hypothetical protein